MNALDQIDALASYIMANIPGEPSQDEGAVNCAIRLLGQLEEAKRADIFGKVRNFLIHKLDRMEMDFNKKVLAGAAADVVTLPNRLPEEQVQYATRIMMCVILQIIAMAESYQIDLKRAWLEMEERVSDE